MTQPDKKTPPPYTTYKSFFNFIKGLRENGMPTHLTRSMLPGSNSGKATMSASLKSLGLINGKEEPTDEMKQLVDPSGDYKQALNKILYNSYAFLGDPNFDIKNTTTDKVAEKFKELGASGSTITKCMAFFLSACKEANIEISKYVKSPTPDRGTSGRRKKRNKGSDSTLDDNGDNDDFEPEFEGSEKIKIPIPLHGMDDGMIIFPGGMSKRDWEYALKIATFLLQNYRPDFDDGQPEEN